MLDPNEHRIQGVETTEKLSCEDSTRSISKSEGSCTISSVWMGK